MKTLIQNLKLILTGKRPLSDVWEYIVGHYRYRLLYWNLRCVQSNYKIINWLRPLRLHRLIRKHIREQIEYRFKWMDQECFWAGSCKICGCTTTQLQMANKSCDKPCYPPMMSKAEWSMYNQGLTIPLMKIRSSYWQSGDERWLKENKTGRPLLLRYDSKLLEYVQIN